MRLDVHRTHRPAPIAHAASTASHRGPVAASGGTGLSPSDPVTAWARGMAPAWPAAEAAWEKGTTQMGHAHAGRPRRKARRSLTPLKGHTRAVLFEQQIHFSLMAGFVVPTVYHAMQTIFTSRTARMLLIEQFHHSVELAM